MARGYIRKVHEIAYHRNGVAGNGFYVVLFTDRTVHNGTGRVAIVFDEPGNVAVLSTLALSLGVIAFGSHSYRGDEYEPELRAAILQWEAQRAVS